MRNADADAARVRAQVAVEVLRFERSRTRWALSVLAATLVIALARATLHSDAPLWRITAAGGSLVVLAAAFEFVMLRAVTRALVEGQSFGGRVWGMVTSAEALFPGAIVGVMAAVARTNGVTDVQLTPPALGLSFIVTLLTVARLRPSHCALSGCVGAAGYAGVMAAFATPESWTEVIPGTITSAASQVALWSMMLIGAGVLAGLVAGELRTVTVRQALATVEQRHAEARSREVMIFALARVAEYRDSDTGTHLERVAGYCEILARRMRSEELGLDDDWVARLRVASSLHDIGKVGVPDSVLRKPGPLTPDERREMERHPEMGAAALRDVRALDRGDALLNMSIDVAAAHHERWDGAGYPHRLKGEDIPLSARIMAAADVYDALTSDRVYRPAMSHEEAMRTIEQGSGTQFDPRVIEALRAEARAFDLLRAIYRATDRTPLS